MSALLAGDFLVVSAYKFFGPHTGILFGRLEHLADPGRIQGSSGAFRPSQQVGDRYPELSSRSQVSTLPSTIWRPLGLGRFDANCPMSTPSTASTPTSESSETTSSKGISELPDVRLFGPPTMENRVTTFAISVDGHHLGRRGDPFSSPAACMSGQATTTQSMVMDRHRGPGQRRAGPHRVRALQHDRRGRSNVGGVGVSSSSNRPESRPTPAMSSTTSSGGSVGMLHTAPGRRTNALRAPRRQ